MRRMILVSFGAALLAACGVQENLKAPATPIAQNGGTTVASMPPADVGFRNASEMANSAALKPATLSQVTESRKDEQIGQGAADHQRRTSDRVVVRPQIDVLIGRGRAEGHGANGALRVLRKL